MMTVIVTWDGEKQGVFLDAKYPEDAVARLVRTHPHIEGKNPTGQDYAGRKKSE